eukprot:6431092-Amphidinium_carterae.1
MNPPPVPVRSPQYENTPQRAMPTPRGTAAGSHVTTTSKAPQAPPPTGEGTQEYIMSDEHREKKQRLILNQVTALTTEAQAFCRALEEEGASDRLS